VTLQLRLDIPSVRGGSDPISRLPRGCLGARSRIINDGALGLAKRLMQVTLADDKPGEYVVLMKWYPGFMSAPHTYVTDRLCLVLTGHGG
jgi:hypothetical protein